MPVFECGTVWSPLAEGPFFNGTLVPRIQLAILKTSKIMSWPRLARPRDLVGSLVWRGDDRATEIFFLCPSGGLRSASESPCSACLTPYTQTCPACLPVLVCLLYVVLLFRMLGAPDAWPQPQRRFSSFSHPTYKFLQNVHPSPLFVEGPGGGLPAV